MSNNIDQLAEDCGKEFERLEEQFRYLTTADNTEYDEYARVKNLQSRFTRWKRNAGADSLEQQLNKNTRVKLQVIRLLSHIQRLLDDAHAVTVGDRVPWDQVADDEDSQSDDETASLGESPKTEMEQIMAHVADAIDNLSYLGTALREPLADSRTLDETPPSEPFDVQHILSKYPGVDKAIAERLGKAISARRQLFQDQESTEQSTHHSKGLLADEPTLEDLTSQLDLEDLTYQGSEQKGILDEDSSETSSIASEDLGAHQIPPLPQRAPDGRPFRCPLCRQMVRASSTKDWKTHVYSDLRPYICLETNCSKPQHQYARQKDWIFHVLGEHWRIYACPFGCNLRFTSRNGCREHLCRKHIDQKHLSEIEDLVQLSTVDKTEVPVKTTCPLCKKPLQDIERYQSHVGRHQRALTVFAIPQHTVEGGIELRIYEGGQPSTQDTAPETSDIEMQEQAEKEELSELGGQSDTSEDSLDNRSLDIGSYAGGITGLSYTKAN
ncbi:hypothetical protein FPANT_4195 [Fusarium pseudoanthophilum]|uniref:C2H2-type domain-containing protein n=1 Tax=Fusarium pseudoanthophilum TaxID=48495 RepID=A0A8H5PI88_9HYPO|nr:hypothetical protein FPANT_4195 [Fusarium pseudoanthophilum]